jgi:cellulase/cellobiase CelA1
VVSYVRTAATNSLNFAVNDFLTDAISRGHAQRAWYLTSIQAGFEPWVGGAGLAVNSFSVTTGGGGPTTTTTTPTTTPTTPPSGPAACRVGYVPNTWPGGFTANITLTNTGSSTINGWTVGFTFPGNQQLGTNRWEATFTQTGAAVTARDVGHNATLAPGASTSFGFQGTYSGTNNSPTAFTVNGSTCSAG